MFICCLIQLVIFSYYTLADIFDGQTLILNANLLAATTRREPH